MLQVTSILLFRKCETYMRADPFDDFVSSDLQTSEAAQLYADYVNHVRNGRHAMLELTGNAFHVRFEPELVTIESLWDDELPVLQLTLSEFSQRLQGSMKS
jgi:hypothetical protein